MKKNNNSFSFSHRLIKVYTLIFAIPIMLIVTIAMAIFWTRQVNNLKNESEKQIQEYTNSITSDFNSMVLAENIFMSNQSLLQTFYYTREEDTPDIIEEIKNFTDEIEHIKLVMPRIYGMRAFVQNEAIPERWPVIFKENRLSSIALSSWNYNYVADLMGNIESAKIPSVCFQSEMSISRKHLGYVQVSMKMEDVFPFLYDNSTPKSQKNFVFKDGQSLYAPSLSNSTVITQNEVENRILSQKFWKKYTDYSNKSAKAGSKKNTFTAMIDGTLYIAACSQIQPQNLVIIHANSLTRITLTILMFFFLCIAVIIFSVITMFFVIKYATGRVTEGLTKVIDGMNQVRHENYDVEIKVDTNDEIGQMAQTFTKMVKKIKEQINRIETEQKLLAETEIKAMQNQINAHFLYNALETIKMQAELADEDDIVESITLLGKMMHYCLRWKNPNVTLKEEVEYIQCYVQMLNIRNDYYVTLNIDLPQEFENIPIMKMLLQPVIENAFYHGIEPRGTDSTIRLSTSLDSEKNILWISIADMGIGMTEDELQKLLQHMNDPAETESKTRTSIGLKNIQERLYVFFGKDYKIQIESKKDEGTTVKVPIKYVKC